ncbi:MAG: hypothetical protein IPK60_16100 [Sandaracinaceae bacterium]|nr:hypothetical protein [Sandaracinaceae bacterium]
MRSVPFAAWILVSALVACGTPAPALVVDAGADAGDVDAGANANLLSLRTVRDAVSRNAVCNDGTAAIYYVHRSVARSTRWVVYLGGGGFAANLDEVFQRQMYVPELVTSTGAPTTMDGAGLLSSRANDNPDFYNDNLVFVRYCSSDVWSGDREASTETANFEFRGKAIVRAVLEDLSDSSLTEEPNLASASELLFAGGSAGGIGVLSVLDEVAAQLQAVNVRGFCDAGWLTGVASFAPPLLSLAQGMTMGRPLWNGHADSDCVAAHADDETACYLGEFAYPHLQTPIFINISQLDGALLLLNHVPAPMDTDSAELIAIRNLYFANFAALTRDSLSLVTACYSAIDIAHAVGPSAEFTSRVSLGETTAHVLGNWYFGRPGVTHLIQQPE